MKVTTDYVDVAVTACINIWMTAFFVHKNDDISWWLTALLMCAAAITVQVWAHYRKKRQLNKPLVRVIIEDKFSG